MKKIRIKFILLLILGLIAQNAVFSLEKYNYFIAPFLMKLLDHKTSISYDFEIPLYIYLVSVVVFCMIIFFKLFKIIAKKDIEDITANSDNKIDILKKETRRFVIITIFAQIIIMIYWLLYDMYIINYNYLGINAFIEKNDLGTNLIAGTLIVMYLVALGFYIKNILKTKKRTNNNIIKILSIIKNIYFVSISIVTISAAIYYYLPINEFKYGWREEDGKLICWSYQDIRKAVTNDIKLPNRLFNKKAYFEGLYVSNPNINILFPNDIEYDQICNLAVIVCERTFNSILIDNYFDIEYEGSFKIDGNGKDCYIDNNILYTNDGSKIHFFTNNKYDDYSLQLSKNFRQFDSGLIAFKNLNKLNIEIDSKNPYYYYKDSVIYSKGNASCIKDGNVGVSEYYLANNLFLATPVKKNAVIYLTNDIPDNALVFTNIGLNLYATPTIYITKEFNKRFEMLSGGYGIKSYEVEEGNLKYYAKTNLYEKGTNKLLYLATSDSTKLDNDMKEMSKDAVESIKYSNPSLIEDFKSGDLIIQDNNIYTSDQSKILAYTTHYGGNETLNIKKNTKEIDNELLATINSPIVEINIEDNNPYLTFEDGLLLSKDKTNLIMISKYISNALSIPREVSNINENVYKFLANYYLSVEDGNEYFEVYSGDLYTRGREKLLALGISDTHIIAKETNEISKDALKSICGRNIFLENENTNFVIADNVLWTKNKEELLITLEDCKTIYVNENTRKISDAYLEEIYLDKHTSIYRYFEVDKNNLTFYSSDGNLYENNKLIITRDVHDGENVINLDSKCDNLEYMCLNFETLRI